MIEVTKDNISSINRFQVTGRIDVRTREEAFPLISGNVIAGCKRKENVADFAQKVLSAFLTEFATASVFLPLNLGYICRLAGEYFSHWVKVKSREEIFAVPTVRSSACYCFSFWQELGTHCI